MSHAFESFLGAEDDAASRARAQGSRTSDNVIEERRHHDNEDAGDKMADAADNR